MTFIPAYKPGQQFDSRWREEPPECNWPEPHDCYLDDCVASDDTDWAVICPRECPSPKTEHCVGWLRNGRAQCWHCGKWMPMEEAIGFSEDEPSPECEGGCGPRCACAYDRRDKTEDDR